MLVRAHRRRVHHQLARTGELLGLSGDMIRIELDDKTGGQAMIALADLEKANLVEEF